MTNVFETFLLNSCFHPVYQIWEEIIQKSVFQHTFAYVSACVFDGGVAVDVGQQAEAEAVLIVGWVCEAVHQDAAG